MTRAAIVEGNLWGTHPLSASFGANDWADCRVSQSVPLDAFGTLTVVHGWLFLDGRSGLYEQVVLALHAVLHKRAFVQGVWVVGREAFLWQLGYSHTIPGPVLGEKGSKGLLHAGRAVPTRLLF